MIWFGLFILAIIALGMYGGQKLKGTRRFGIPGLSFLLSLKDGFQWRDLALLLLIPTLVTGYGQNSIFMDWFGSDTLVRLFYALLLAIPFIVYGGKRFLIALVFLVGAFQVRAGSFGYVSWFGDFLIEDFVRYGVLGVLIFFFFIIKKA